MNILLKVIICGITLFLTAASGVWLSKRSRPLNKIVCTIHKLIALAFVIFAGLMAYGYLLKNFTSTLIILIITLVLFIIALFISGAFLSFEKNSHLTANRFHKIFSALTFVGFTLFCYLII